MSEVTTAVFIHKSETFPIADGKASRKGGAQKTFTKVSIKQITSRISFQAVNILPTISLIEIALTRTSGKFPKED